MRFTDNFNRVDGALGSPWTSINTLLATLIISSNQCIGSTNLQPQAVRYHSDLFTDSQFGQVKVVTFGSPAERSAIILRAKNVASSFQYYRFGCNTATYTFMRYNPGQNNLKTGSWTAVNGDTIKFSVVNTPSGALLRVYKNNVLADSYTDSTILVGGTPGLWTYSDYSTYYDDWVCGTVGPDNSPFPAGRP